MSSLLLSLRRITLTRQSGYRQDGLFASHVQQLEHNGLSVDRVDEESEADLSDPTSTSNVASRRQILLDTGLKERRLRRLEMVSLSQCPAGQGHFRSFQPDAHGGDGRAASTAGYRSSFRASPGLICILARVRGEADNRWRLKLAGYWLSFSKRTRLCRCWCVCVLMGSMKHLQHGIVERYLTRNDCALVHGLCQRRSETGASKKQVGEGWREGHGS